MKTPRRPLRSKSAAATAPALIGSGGSASPGPACKPPWPSFRKSLGWYSCGAGGQGVAALGDEEIRRLPVPSASKRSERSVVERCRARRSRRPELPAAAPARRIRSGIQGRAADDHVVAPVAAKVADRERRARAGSGASGRSRCWSVSSTASSRDRSDRLAAWLTSSNWPGGGLRLGRRGRGRRWLGDREAPVDGEVLEGLHVPARPRHDHAPDDRVVAEAEMQHGLAARHVRRGRARAGATWTPERALDPHGRSRPRSGWSGPAQAR